MESLDRLDVVPVSLVRSFCRAPGSAALPSGRILHANLRRHMLTEAELNGALRGSGVADVADVKLASPESNGRG